MVAGEQMLLSLEPPEILLRWLFVSEHQVAKNIDGIVLSDLLVPLVDQDLIHFLDVIEGTVAVPDNIFVTKVQVTRE